jgi:hypothetical protein
MCLSNCAIVLASLLLFLGRLGVLSLFILCMLLRHLLACLPERVWQRSPVFPAIARSQPFPGSCSSTRAR